MDARSKQLIIDNISALRGLAEKFKAYEVVREVDLHRIIYFLTQFNSYEEIEIILRLLKNIDFLSNERITYLLRKAYEEIDENIRANAYVSQLGGISDSSAVVCYQLTKQIFHNENQTRNKTITIDSLGRDILRETPTSIIFFDDNITSGTQLKEFFVELIEGRDDAELVKTSLTPEEYEALKKIPIKICYAVQLSGSSNKVVEEIIERFKINLKIHYGKSDDNNYLDFQSNTINSEEEAVFAKKFIQEIAHALYEDKEWNKDTIYQRLLGYGNLGKLTAFYYNVPKSLIPVFWKFGYYKGKPWIPLFPETQEQKKILKDKVEFDFYRTETISSWLNSTPNHRAPKISFGFHMVDGVMKDLEIEIPSEEFIYSEFVSKIMFPRARYEQNRFIQIEDYGTHLYSSHLSRELTEGEYEKYKMAIDEFNINVQAYRKKIGDFLWHYSSSKKIIMYVVNEGNKAATNCNVKIGFNSGEILIDNKDALERTPYQLRKPDLKEYHSGYKGQIMPFDKGYVYFENKQDDSLIEIGASYEFRVLKEARIAHNDWVAIDREFTRVDKTKSQVEIVYSITIDEEPEPIIGNLNVKFIMKNTIPLKLRTEIEGIINLINADMRSY